MITEADARELEAALKSTEGREQIAQTMYEPFKKGRDYVAIFRQIFAVDHLPAGAPSWYDLDPQFTAAVVGPKGGVVFSEIEATRINVDPQILAVYPKVHALDVAVRRFNILDREQERAQHEMAKIIGQFKATDMLETPKTLDTTQSQKIEGENSKGSSIMDGMDNQQRFVKCVICGKKFKGLQGHVVLHGLTPKEYKKKFNAPIVGKTHMDSVARSLKTRMVRYGQFVAPVTLKKGQQKISELVKLGTFSMQIKSNCEKAHKAFEVKYKVKNAMQVPEIAARNLTHRHDKPGDEEQWIQENFPTLSWVGDFKFKLTHPITGKVKYPDFIGGNVLVEMFGDFWHSRRFKGKDRKEHEEEILKFYEDCGYPCCIVWASEVKKNPEGTRQKITNFLRDYQVATEKSVMV